MLCQHLSNRPVTTDELTQVFLNDIDLLDTADLLLYIPDVSITDEGDPILHGVNLVDLLMVKDHLDNPVAWALGHTPAAGTCAPNRMDFISVNTARVTLADHFRTVYTVTPDEFNGFTVRGGCYIPFTAFTV